MQRRSLVTETHTSGPTRLVRPRNTAAMQRRRRALDPSRDWTRSDEHLAPSGCWLRPGTEFSVYGERGRYRFLEYVDTGKAHWVSAIGGTKGVRMYRAFEPGRIKKVFVGRQIMTNAEARELVNDKNREKRSAA